MFLIFLTAFMRYHPCYGVLSRMYMWHLKSVKKHNHMNSFCSLITELILNFSVAVLSFLVYFLN